MTEYGRSPGSAPWHPEDPLYGDPGWTGHQDPAAHTAPYGAVQGQQPQDVQHAGYQEPYQQQYGEQQLYGQQHGGGQHLGEQPAAGPAYAQQPDGSALPYGQLPDAGPASHGSHGQLPDGAPHYAEHQQAAGQHYAQQTYGEQHYAEHPQAVAQQQAEQHYPEQYPAGGWEAGQQPGLPYDPLADPYAAGTPDLYPTADAYPPPEPPDRRSPQQPEAPADAEADAEPEQETHPFFTGDDGGGDDGAEKPGPAVSRRGGSGGSGRDGRGGGRDGRGGRSKKQRKSRNGVACLVVAAVLVSGLGGVGYFGYQFWQGRFGAAPDFTGAGSGTVQVEIPQGSLGASIGQILKKNGVVKSVDAFVAAQGSNPDGQKIQAGVYTLKKGMSAANAVKTMLDWKSRSSLIIPEGKRNAWIYEQIDNQLQLEVGTTEKVAEDKAGKLGLPAWAKGHPDVKDPLEGFLFPASYPVAKGSKPEDVLRKMVTRANQEYSRIDLAAEAKKLDLEGPWQLITVASLVQAEGKTDDDFRKMAEVVYNRLKPDNIETMRKIQFDSAFNYLNGQSEIRISESEINSNPDPYNTYYHAGLTPGPIGNPGIEALEAALKPTDDGWMYFVATDGMNKTEFAKNHDEFEVLKDKFNESGVE